MPGSDVPQLACCPGVKLPTKLTGAYFVSLPGPNCTVRQFPMPWSGGGYNGGADNVTASVTCTGSSGAGIRLQWDVPGGPCADHKVVMGGGCTPFAIAGSSSVQQACCVPGLPEPRRRS